MSKNTFTIIALAGLLGLSGCAADGTQSGQDGVSAVLGAVTSVLFGADFSASGQNANSENATDEDPDPDAGWTAVQSLAAKQGCLITEDEIYDAMRSAGDDSWGINAFITNGTKNGTLKLVSKKNDVYTYRLNPCKPSK